MFARDRDLLIFEPSLPMEVDWAGQRLLDAGVGDVVGGIAVVLSQPSTIVGLGLAAGQLVRLSGVWGELIEAGLPNALAVSKLRPAPDGPPIPLAADATGVTGIRIVSFAPQLAIVHRQIIEALRLESDGLTLDAVLNPRAIARVEALGALHLIYAGAAAMTAAAGQTGSALSAKAEMYHHRFIEQRAALSARLDTNGDGEEDEVRSVNARRFDNTQRFTRG